MSGIGNAGGFRMMVEDRAGRGPQALQAAVGAMMGRAAQTPGLQQVFSLFETSTPQLYLDIDRTKAQLLGINVADVFAALQIYLGSAYVNDFNLFGRTFRVQAQADAEYRLEPKDVLQAARAQFGRRHRAARLVHDRARHFRAVSRAALQSSIRRPSSTATRRPATARGRRSRSWRSSRPRRCREGFAFEWTTLAFQQIRAGNTAMFAFALARRVRVPGAGRAIREPDAAARRHPDRADVPRRGDHRRDPARQDNNILTQVGFIVLIGLAAKNAILIVEFAKQLEDQGRDRFEAAVEAARLRLRPILMTSLAFIFGVMPLVWAIGAGAELRQTLGTTVFSGMIGVTAFGLIFTPVFYVVCRWIAGLGARRKGGAPAPHPAE